MQAFEMKYFPCERCGEMMYLVGGPGVTGWCSHCGARYKYIDDGKIRTFTCLGRLSEEIKSTVIAHGAGRQRKSLKQKIMKLLEEFE